MRNWLAILFIFSGSTVHAKETALTIYTYGGGEILSKVFNVVAAIFNTMSSDYDLALIIALNIGLFSAIILAMNKMSLSPIWKSWLIPAFLTISLFTVNSEKIVIYDVLVKKDSKPKVTVVENVPVLLAYTAHFMSHLSYGMTEMLEKVAHTVDDPIYNWTGHIYAGKSLFNARKLRIVDGVTRENLHNFCRECVFRDLGLGLYTRKELEEAPNILMFLEERTSKIRGVGYRSARNESAPGKIQTISCHDAISEIRKNLKNQLADSKEILFGAIGNDYKYLLDKSKNAPIQEIVEQQMAIDALNQFTAGRYDNLAAKRAEQMQMESQKTLGAMGATSIVALRNYLEAFCYLVFPLIIIISLCFLGFKALFSWGQLLAWVSFWPPCYVCANFLLESIWQSRKSSLGLSTSSYNLLTSEGLFQLYNQMESIACAIFLAIPFLSWGLLFLARGGATAMMHWASSFNQAAQSAASTASAEQVTGNYSYSNLSLASQGLGNTSHFQKNASPSFAKDSISTTSSHGRTTTSTQGQGLSIDERRSSLISDISSSEGFSKSLQTQLREGESQIESQSQIVSTNIGNTINSAQGLNEHCSKTAGQTEGMENSRLTSCQKMWQEGFNKVEDYAASHNMDTSKAFDEVLRIGGSIGFGAGNTSTINSVRDLTSDQKSERIGQAQSVYKSLQDVAQGLEKEGIHLTTDEGFRSYKDFAQSWNKTESSLNQLSDTYSKQQSWESLRSGVESQDLRVSRSLNNDYVEYLSDKVGDVGEIQNILSDPQSRNESIKEFVGGLKPEGYISKPNYGTKQNMPAQANEWMKKLDQDQTNFTETRPSEKDLYETNAFRQMKRLKGETSHGVSSQDVNRIQRMRKIEGDLHHQYQEKSSEENFSFLSQVKDHSMVAKTVRKAVDAVPESIDPRKGLKLPGWDELSDEQKIAALDLRFDNEMP